MGLDREKMEAVGWTAIGVVVALKVLVPVADWVIGVVQDLVSSTGFIPEGE